MQELHPGVPRFFEFFCERAGHSLQTDPSPTVTISLYMPRGLERFYGSHDLHFITCSCYQRRPILRTAHRRDLFRSVLEEERLHYRFVVQGYVVMPEHFHLLMTEPDRGTPSTVMQVVKQRFALELHKAWGRGRRRQGMSGRSASTISTCGARRKRPRSCATYTTIP